MFWLQVYFLSYLLLLLQMLNRSFFSLFHWRSKHAISVIRNNTLFFQYKSRLSLLQYLSRQCFSNLQNFTISFLCLIQFKIKKKKSYLFYSNFLSIKPQYIYFIKIQLLTYSLRGNTITQPKNNLVI